MGLISIKMRVAPPLSPTANTTLVNKTQIISDKKGFTACQNMHADGQVRWWRGELRIQTEEHWSERKSGVNLRSNTHHDHPERGRKGEQRRERKSREVRRERGEKESGCAASRNSKALYFRGNAVGRGLKAINAVWKASSLVESRSLDEGRPSLLGEIRAGQGAASLPAS